MKKTLSLMLAVILTMGLMVPVSVSAAQNSISVMVNGEAVSFDVPPQIINSRTMVPMRAIFEKLGLYVTWDDASKTVYAKNTDISIAMQVGSDFFTRNGKEIYLDSPAVIRDSRTLVPVRAISEALSMKVDWNGDTRVVTVSDIPYTGHYIRSQGERIPAGTELADGIYDVSLEPDSAYYAADGTIKIMGQVYTYDIYDIVDIAKLAVGDIIQFKNEDIKVVSIDREYGMIEINGGHYSGTGLSLGTSDDSNGWRTWIENDYADSYPATDVMTFTVEPGTILYDEAFNNSPWDAPAIIDYGSIVGYIHTNSFGGGKITVEDGYVTEIYRHWAP